MVGALVLCHSVGCGVFLDQGLNPCPLHCIVYDCGSESRSVMPDSLRPRGQYSPWNSPGQNTGGGSIFFFQGRGVLPNPGIEPRSPALQVDSLPAEPQGKPKNTGVGSLSLLRDSNLGLLHSKQIPYQLSYQGSPALVGVGP